MKNRDLFNLYKILKMLEGRVMNIKFSYFVAKNKMKIKNEFSLFEIIQKPDDDYIEYDKKRAQLAMQFADKNEQGQPKIENGSFIIIEKYNDFMELLSKVKEEYKDAIDKQDKKLADFEDILDDEIKFNGLKVDLKDIPKEIEPSVLEILIESGLVVE